eukprot:TRINITY_DN4771_c0_g1_i1.p2 TRINITY_DN4771_c0_g1~~TRINITY_DN4771_c0_g1_i1.p2  ORF type:complete len:107 (-),score=3.91 TRINITY_DN4771_c0_g1_i1:339-659(-)
MCSKMSSMQGRATWALKMCGGAGELALPTIPPLPALGGVVDAVAVVVRCFDTKGKANALHCAGGSGYNKHEGGYACRWIRGSGYNKHEEGMLVDGLESAGPSHCRK